MKEIVEKITQVEREIADEKGSFILFALFLREDAPDLWDLVVCAPWIAKNKQESLKYLAEKIKEALKPEQFLKISRIVMIEQDNPALQALQTAIDIEHGMAEIQHTDIFGLQIKHAYLITSRREEHSTHNKPM